MDWVIFISSFLGALVGSVIASSIFIRGIARRWGYNMNKGINEYMDERQKELEEKINRSTF